MKTTSEYIDLIKTHSDELRTQFGVRTLRYLEQLLMCLVDVIRMHKHIERVGTMALTYIIILFAAISLGACDYFGYFHFEIINNTDESLEIVYTEQMQSFTTVLYTPDYENDFQTVFLNKMLTDTVIPPKGKLILSYEAGMVDRDFPDQLEDPKNYGILPLWERIGYMIQRGDTLDSRVFSQSQWKGKGSTYTLIIEK